MEHPLAKTLVGNFETCVRDNLTGFVASHPGLKILEDFNVVFHEDMDEIGKQKVCLISGGGSGHEPSQTGFVGPGMLTASVAGEIFASPSAVSILSAIQIVASRNSEILLIVPNYTGDRLNFGLALERARLQGVAIESVIVGEDCAFKGLKKTAGRRGLCGIIFVHKIAGALAAEGKPLKEIQKIAQEAVNSLGTISVSLTPCNIPGRGASFQLKSDELELGLGIHGEAGVERLKMMPASEIVKVMFEHMTDPDSSSRISVEKGDRIALLVNNLGGLSQLEFYIVIKELLCLLEMKGIAIERMYCGTLNTSLDMAGISFSILKLNDMFKACLDAPTKAPSWPKVFIPNTMKYPQCHTTDLKKLQVGKPQELLTESIALTGPMLTAQNHKNLLLAIETACKELIANESHLNSLDLEAGDGDCGSTLRKGAEAILVALKDGKISSYPRHILLTLASLAEIHMGGSSGALYSLFFTAGSSAFSTNCDVESWLNALKLGITVITKHGGATIGDRTMLDVLWPAYLTLKEKLPILATSSRNFAGIFQDMITLLTTAACETAKMSAKAGRASYVNPDRLKNPDPGAEAVAIWLTAVLKTFISA